MLILIAPALAWESPPAEVVLMDETNLFESLAVNTGWLPGNSPVEVAFEITSSGGSWVEMEGESFLVWPESVTHGYEPEPGTGLFELDAEIGADVLLKVDAGGIYYEGPISSVVQVFEDEVEFDPWLLDDGTGEPVWVETASPGQDTVLVSQSFTITTGVSVYVEVDWRTDVQAAFTGVRFDSNGSIIDTEGQTELFDPPDDGLLVLDSVFTGRYRTALGLVLVPRFGVCVEFIGCTDIAAFDVPIDMLEDDFDKDFEPQIIEHGTPVLGVDTETCDFGKVALGQIAHCEIALANLGGFDVEGSAGILGAGEFTIWPEDLLARPDTVDGITVTFAPTFEGEQSASLILNTSDPSKDALDISLVGVGFDDQAITVITSESGVCGCASDGGAPGPAWALVLLGGLVARRRGLRAASD